MDTLYQFLSISIQGIERINGIVLGLVGSRVVEHEQRIETLDTRLRSIAFHLLWFVHNDDGMISGYHINRSATSELIPFGVNDASSLIPFLAFTFFLIH